MRFEKLSRILTPLICSFVLLVAMPSCKKQPQQEPTGLGQQSDVDQPATKLPTGKDCLVTSTGEGFNPNKPTNFFKYLTGGAKGPFTNAVDVSGPYAVVNSGNHVFTLENKNQIGPNFDPKGGNVLALKLLNEGSQIAIGTSANLQVCSINLSAGEISDCQSYNAAGGVNDITELRGMIYATTIGGDVIQVPMDDLQGQSSCGIGVYSAKDHMVSETKSPQRAFRIAAAHGKVYFLTRNNTGSTAFTLNSFLGSLLDWFDPSKDRWFYRTTHLYRYDPSNNTVKEITPPNSDKWHFFMDDITSGPEDKVYVSYWAPREQDHQELNQCSDLSNPAAPCANGANTFLTWAAAFLYSTSGILEIPSEGPATQYEATPAFTWNPSGGPCNAQQLALFNCIRFPNLGFYYINRIADSGDAVYVRGMLGYARLKNSQLQTVFVALPTNPNKGDLGMSFDLAAGDQGLLNGYFGVHITGPDDAKMESAVISGTSSLSLTASQFFVESILLRIGAGPNRIYSKADNNMPGVNLADSEFIGVDYSGENYLVYQGVPQGKTLGNPIDILYDTTSTTTVFSSEDGSQEGIAQAFVNLGGGPDMVINFYQKDQVDPVFIYDAMPYVHTSLPGLHGVHVFEDFAFTYVLNQRPPAGPPNYKYFVKKLDGWPPTNAFDVFVPGYSFYEGGNNVAAILDGEKLDNKYRLIAAINIGSGGAPANLLGVDVVTFSGTEPPVAQRINIPDLRGATAKDGKIYAINKDGDLNIYNVDGANPTTPEKIISGAVPLESFQQLIWAIPVVAGNKMMASVAIISGSPGFGFELSTVLKDLSNDEPSVYSKIHSYLWLFNSGGNQVTAVGPWGRVDVFNLQEVQANQLQTSP